MNKFLSALLVFLSIQGCSAPYVKLLPEYKGVDPKVQPYVDEYLWLSSQHHLTFNHSVTVGLKPISEEGIAGRCTYGLGWREIDLDKDYWKTIKESQKTILVFHELSHCYCDRNHDYGNGTPYPETDEERVAQALAWFKNGGDRPGRWEDGCPISIMYPSVIDVDCIRSHYSEYIEEMFNRCDPW